MEIAICNSHNFSITQPFVIFFFLLMPFLFVVFDEIWMHICILHPFFCSSSIFNLCHPQNFQAVSENVLQTSSSFFFLCVFIVWFYKEDFIAIELPSGIDLYSSSIFTWKTKGTKMQIGKVFFILYTFSM